MNNPTCRVLIVDDSTVFRSQIRNALESVEGIEVVGFASNGKLAMEVLKTKAVDVMTLDLEMPELDGLQTLAEIQRLGINIKTIVFSATTKQGAESTLTALKLGASDFVTKPNRIDLIRPLLVPKILQFGTSTTPVSTSPSQAIPKNHVTPINWKMFTPKVVVIASSTGGPTALEKLFSLIKPPVRCPILMVQHMPPLFTMVLAERLTKLSGIPVKEATDQEPLIAGQVYIAPGDYHMRVVQKENGCATSLDQSSQRNFVRPCADYLFESAASLFSRQCMGIVLTGMGSDGRDGAVAIKNKGGAVIIQNKETCIVYGMPKAVFDARAYDQIATIEEVSSRLIMLGICQGLDQKRDEENVSYSSSRRL